MTDHATPADREATSTPDGKTIDLLIEAFETLTCAALSDTSDCMDVAQEIKRHLFELARRGALFQAEEAN